MDMNKLRLIALKAKIKGLAEEGIRTRDFIKKSSGPKRDYYWMMKRHIGLEARYHLIAYGLIRGMDFKKFEPNTSEAKLLHLNYNYLAQICQRHCHRHYDRWTPVNLKRLITTGTMLGEFSK